jgi:hypothetical protein
MKNHKIMLLFLLGIKRRENRFVSFRRDLTVKGEPMFEKILGFLNIRGWEGVREIYLLIAVGAALGLNLIYYFLIYKRDEKPRRITIKGNIVKIVLCLAGIYLLAKI